MKIICVIAAYNEGGNISQVIKEVKQYVDEVIVVDDCSIDQTFDLAEKAGARVLRLIINRGQGASLRAGTNLAVDLGADIVIHFDADRQFVASEIPLMLEPIIKGRAEAVLGSRFLVNSHHNMPVFKQRVIMPLARLVNYLFLGIKFSDPQCGFRVLNREVAKKLNWQQDRMAHCSEIQFLLAKKKFKVEEVPITVIYHHFGQRLSGAWKVVKDLLVGRLFFD